MSKKPALFGNDLAERLLERDYEQNLKYNIVSIKEQLRKQYPDFNPSFCITLGTGAHPIAKLITDPVKIPYAQLKGIRRNSKVKGHAKEFICGKINGIDVVCLNGRKHAYEKPHRLEIRMLAEIPHQLGAKISIITAATGAINPKTPVGSVVLINDHINRAGVHVLAGENKAPIKRFLPAENFYSATLRETMRTTAQKHSISLGEGHYNYTHGSDFETGREIDEMGQYRRVEKMEEVIKGLILENLQLHKYIKETKHTKDQQVKEFNRILNNMNENFVKMALHISDPQNPLPKIEKKIIATKTLPPLPKSRIEGLNINKLFAYKAGDLAGMSVVPLATFQRALGYKVVALGIVTNPATGVGKQKEVDHTGFRDAAKPASELLCKLIPAFMTEITKNTKILKQPFNNPGFD